MELYIVTEKTEARDWGEIRFEVHGVWPTFEKALEFLKKKKERWDKMEESGEININNRRASWSYSDWDGHYYYNIEPIKYHDSV